MRPNLSLKHFVFRFSITLVRSVAVDERFICFDFAGQQPGAALSETETQSVIHEP